MGQWSALKGIDLESLLEEVYNGPEYRELRRDLARGQLPRFCLESKSCPIVKKMTNGK